jgi:uncharacterized membrane protein YdjX (TVP38/TMEM64 family)
VHSNSGRSRLTLLVALLAVVPLLLVMVGGPSRGDLQRIVDDAGLLAPIAFIGIYIGWTVLGFPGVVPTLAGGALFGVVVGSLLALIGAVAGATAAFLIARRVGRAPVRSLAGPRGPRIEQWLRRNGFLVLLYARLVPVVPFNMLNYAAGLAGMSTRTYVIATSIGIVPGTVAYASLGSASAHPGSWPFIVSIAAVALLTVIAGALSYVRRRGFAVRPRPSWISAMLGRSSGPRLR